ncbi:glycosyltransferase [Tropicimonas sp. S265A]|uniref:glycosyltransferase n=1 Tax=Tropicimonas sp. S265A TaxID=3415134 RepID=UPI003C7BDAA3
MSEPLPDAGWSRTCLTVPDAIVCPPKEYFPLGPCGVWNDQGDVAQAAHWRKGQRFTTAVAEAPAPVNHLKGKHLWAGILFGHFGHFLTESISRLWAVEDERPDSVIFIPRHARLDNLDAFRGEMCDLLGIGVPIQIIADPTSVEELVVPGQGFGLGSITAGTPEFWAMMQRMADRVQEDAPRKIYISRTEFGGKGGVICEDVLERNMEAAGYETLHPQRLSVSQQIAAYKSATHVVGLDSSAFHMVGFASQPQQQVSIVLRRNTDDHIYIAAQLEATLEKPPQIINALSANWAPSGQQNANHNSYGELDHDRLFGALRDTGFVDPNASWTPPSGAEKEAAVKQAADRCGEPLVRLEVKETTETTSPAVHRSTLATYIRSEKLISDGRPKVLGVCRFSMLGRGDWKAYRGQPDDKLEDIYEQKAEELFAEARMKSRLATLEHLTLGAMTAQSDQESIFLVLSSDRMPKHYRDRLAEICNEVPQAVLQFIEPMHVSDAIRKATTEMEIELSDCLQYRLDDDDCVAFDFTRRARRHARTFWDYSNFAISFAQQYYCVSDGPTEGIYNWWSPFFSAGASVRHNSKTVFDFGHYKIPNRLPALTDPHFPNIVTHRGDNDTPRHEAAILRKRGMKPASAKEVMRTHERHFHFLSPKGLELCGFDKVLKQAETA